MVQAGGSFWFQQKHNAAIGAATTFLFSVDNKMKRKFLWVSIRYIDLIYWAVTPFLYLPYRRSVYSYSALFAPSLWTLKRPQNTPLAVTLFLSPFTP